MVDEIDARGGAIDFREFMELALYDSRHGYYSSDRPRYGRRGDFLIDESVGEEAPEREGPAVRAAAGALELLGRGQSRAQTGPLRGPQEAALVQEAQVVGDVDPVRVVLDEYPPRAPVGGIGENEL